MDVFLVPVAAGRYELYCEEHGDHAVATADPPRGFVRRAAQRFRDQIDQAERAQSASADPPRSWSGRVKARMLRWVAESIAEQRLLWQLRGRAAARLIHPDDLTGAQAQQLLRRTLTRDWEGHRFWLLVDGVLGVASLTLVLIPGPNVIGYYFFFRIFGHYLSLRGARQGLSRTAWTVEPNAALTTLRSVVSHAPGDRAEMVGAVATSLQLEHLPKFFERCAGQT
jgi:Mitochondrial K+-H+ exchange-related